MTYLDKTYCASPHCTNACGRKLPPELKARNVGNYFVSCAYFCGEPAFTSRDINLDLIDIDTQNNERHR